MCWLIQNYKCKLTLCILVLLAAYRSNRMVIPRPCPSFKGNRLQLASVCTLSLRAQLRDSQASGTRTIAMLIHTPTLK